MKVLFRLLAFACVLFLSSCGKKKCDSCPNWGKVDITTDKVEEA